MGNISLILSSLERLRSIMVGVLKIERLDLSTTPKDIRTAFKDVGARPDDIHLVLDKSGRHTGEAFITFLNPENAEKGLVLNGKIMKDKRVEVHNSNPKEFNVHFPGVSMISKNGPGAPRGRGRGRGRGGFPSPMSSPRSGPPFRGETSRGGFAGRGFRGRGRGRGGRGGFSGGDRRSRSPRRDSRDGKRSRSPMDRKSRDSFMQNFSSPRGPPRARSPRQDRGRRDNSPRDRSRSGALPAQAIAPHDVDERKFVHISGMPYTVSENQVHDFFRPVLTREIFLCRNESGKFTGRVNGEAFVEFFSESDARAALKMDGKRFDQRSAKIVRAHRDEILRSINGIHASADRRQPHPLPAPGPSVPAALATQLPALDAATAGNPQVQQLLTLLTATVTSLAASAAAGQALPPQSDSVVGRVASSANIDIHDIKAGKVVGIRNLSFKITPEEILSFFRGYNAIPDSVRIHYLEDGRCSGDAIISFRSNRDAKNAVDTLNKRHCGSRKVDLFFL